VCVHVGVWQSDCITLYVFVFAVVCVCVCVCRCVRVGCEAPKHQVTWYLHSLCVYLHIYVFVCLCVCVCGCQCACASARCLSVCLCVCSCVCVSVSMRLCDCASMSLCVCAHARRRACVTSQDLRLTLSTLTNALTKQRKTPCTRIFSSRLLGDHLLFKMDKRRNGTDCVRVRTRCVRWLCGASISWKAWAQRVYFSSWIALKPA